MATTVSALTGGMLLGAPSASAATNIDGGQPFNTQVMMSNICKSDDRGTHTWYLNVWTGEVKDESWTHKAPVWGWNGSVNFPKRWLNSGWDAIKGHCEYPQSSAWTRYGAEKRITDYAENCSSGGFAYTLHESYATTTTTTKTISGSAGVEIGPLKKIFSVEFGAEFSYSWAYADTRTIGKDVRIDVAAKRTAWIAAKPHQRVVRVNPVLKIDKYWWMPDQDTVVNKTTFRGAAGQDRITSGKYYVDGVSDILKSDGTPDLTYVARDKAASC